MTTTIIFDYNGIIVDDLEVHLQAFLELGRKYNSKTTEEELRAIFHTPTKDKILLMFPNSSEEFIKNMLNEKEDIYIEKATKTDVFFPGTKETILKLAENHTLAIISNTTKKQLLPVLGDLGKFFTNIMTYEDIPKPKPAPDSLLKTMEILNKKPEECCYVGDAPSDMKAAKNSNILAIGIPTGFNSKKELLEAGADKIINNIKELPEVLD